MKVFNITDEDVPYIAKLPETTFNHITAGLLGAGEKKAIYRCGFALILTGLGYDLIDRISEYIKYRKSK